MSIGSRIQEQRRNRAMTQENLAQVLGVTNQAVSKWETDQSCPDTMLLPTIADALGVSIDFLFEREAAASVPVPEEPAQPGQEEKPGASLPWEDDGAFHVAVYCGHALVAQEPAGEKITFRYNGPVRDLYCGLNVECDDVEGNVSAGGYVECSDVSGTVNAGSYVECGDVTGDVSAGGYVECGDVTGDVRACSYVECGDVSGTVNAGSRDVAVTVTDWNARKETDGHNEGIDVDSMLGSFNEMASGLLEGLKKTFKKDE